ncbi:calretinin-like isoform X2 [Anneissia japonica]|uniref:calretinin-like isoform X2 n=1 Tax=Anneissia japonica TaxID=1529436 RepID=UPI0014255562|nr:calretinin-like isoform X2 [Anneissia japonica]
MAESKNFLTKFHLEAGISKEDFQKIWNNYDTDNNGCIEKKELEKLSKDILKDTPSDMSEKYMKQLMTFFDVTGDGKLNVAEMLKTFQVKEDVAANTAWNTFLGQFRSETGISTADFMKIWMKYDTDKNGYIEKGELHGFLKDLMKEKEAGGTLEEYKACILQRFDWNMDGKLDLKEMSRLCPVEENYIEKLKSAGSFSKANFDKIFQHYDRDNNGSVDGTALQGFLKDLLEASGFGGNMEQIESYAVALKDTFDENNDGKFQKDELMMVLSIFA